MALIHWEVKTSLTVSFQTELSPPFKPWTVTSLNPLEAAKRTVSCSLMVISYHKMIISTKLIIVF